MILFVTRSAFYPHWFCGDSARLYVLISGLRRLGWSVAVLHCHDLEQTFVDYRLMAQHCDFLEVFYPTEDDLARQVSNRLDDWCPPELITRLRTLVQRVRPLAVVAQFVMTSACLAALEGDHSVLRILDADNVFAGRAQLYSSFEIPYTWFSTDAAEEQKGLRRADVILAVQEREARIFARDAPGRPILLVPFSTVVQSSPTGERGVLLFVGAANNENAAGLQAFIDNGLPIILQQFPNVRLQVAGSVCDRITNERPGVWLCGVVPDLTSLYRAANLVLNTTGVGTGLKTKTVEALCFGRCLISTAAGVDGLQRFPDAFVLAETPQDFASAICGLLREPARITAIERRAINVARSLFASEQVVGRIHELLMRWSRFVNGEGIAIGREEMIARLATTYQV